MNKEFFDLRNPPLGVYLKRKEEKSLNIATVAMKVEFDKERNLEKYERFIDEATLTNARLIVFPEQSLQGYLYGALGPLDLERTQKYQWENAEPVPGGKSIQRLIKKAKEEEMYIVFGMTELATDERPEALYNTAVLLGPKGYIGKYRKVHLPADELHIYVPGKSWPVFDLGFAKIGLQICYDRLFPEPSRELALQGCEILVWLSAWDLVKIGAKLRCDYSAFIYDLCDRARSMENQLWSVGSNQVGRNNVTEYFGQSRILYPGGMICAETGWMKEGMITASINVKSGIAQARLVDFLGGNLLKDRRPQTYLCLHKSNH
jgi:predicted amidohydrolase